MRDKFRLLTTATDG